MRERQATIPELAGVQLLLVEDPRPLSLQALQDGEDKRNVYLALSPAAARLSQSWQEQVAALLSLFLAGVSTLGYATRPLVVAVACA